MNTLITRSVTASFGTAINAAGAMPDLVRTNSVQAGKIALDTFTLGVRFHALLTRIKDSDPLDAKEKSLLPYLNAVRHELRSMGVKYIDPEVRLPGVHPFPNSRCDMLLKGGLAPVGVAEIKVTGALPDRPADAHLMQLAVYEELVARNHNQTRLWGCVAYVSFTEKQVRIFAYRDVTAIRRTACNLLAA
jgi:hypothetical protein